MKKKIGIPCWQTSNDSMGISLPYLEYFGKFGTIIPLLPNKDIMEELDLVVLPGGADISSFIYEEVPNYRNSNADRFKEFFFMNNLPLYIDNGTPIFGVCLGMQQLNIHFGGKMLQHWPFPSSIKERGEQVEELKINMDLYKGRFEFKGNKVPDELPRTVKVNSLHHQGVLPYQLAKDLEALAIADKAGNVEALCHKTLPIAGVQWHPEELIVDVFSRNIIKTLLNHNN